MKTTLPKISEVVRQWHLIDAAGTPAGRLAVECAKLLRGKHKRDYAPHVDCGDFVIIINAEKAVLTGKKLEQKYYRTHSGYVGGLKETKYRNLMADKPEFALRHAVVGMLPKSPLGRKMATKMHVYSGAEHEHAAQQPEVLNLIK